jgi:hypothetical protein
LGRPCAARVSCDLCNGIHSVELIGSDEMNDVTREEVFARVAKDIEADQPIVQQQAGCDHSFDGLCCLVFAVFQFLNHRAELSCMFTNIETLLRFWPPDAAIIGASGKESVLAVGSMLVSGDVTRRAFVILAWQGAARHKPKGPPSRNGSIAARDTPSRRALNRGSRRR